MLYEWESGTLHMRKSTNAMNPTASRLSLEGIPAPDHAVQRRSRTNCEQLATTLCDKNGVLELSRALSVHGHGSPVVGPEHVPVDTQVDHRLDREDVPRLHGTLGLILGVMRHIGCCVEQGANAMAAVGGDDGALGGFDDDVDALANIAEGSIRNGIEEDASKLTDRVLLGGT